MLNQVVLVGRIVQEPVLKKIDGGKTVANITLAVSRSYKNVEGEYETDFIPCTLWMGIAENTVEYCKKGDLVGIKGRIQTRIAEVDEDTKRQYIEVIAERVTFLANRRHEETE